MCRVANIQRSTAATDKTQISFEVRNKMQANNVTKAVVMQIKREQSH